MFGLGGVLGGIFGDDMAITSTNMTNSLYNVYSDEIMRLQQQEAYRKMQELMEQKQQQPREPKPNPVLLLLDE